MSFPKTVQAIAISKTGDLDVIEKVELPFPEVQPTDLVVKVQRGGVNFIDTYYRQGLYPIKSFPAVVGTESSGTIVALPTDESVLNNEEYKKRGFALGGTVATYQLGAFSEYVSVPWAKVYAVPESLDKDVAAASLTQGLTAITLMSEAYDVQRGDTVLVHTVAGGLGLLFAQYAKLRGARVIGTTSTKEKAALARENGADEVILYKEEDTVARVLELTGGEGVEAVFDGVGKDTFDANFKLLKRKGTLVSVGNASGAVPPMAPLKLVEKNLKLVRPTMGNYVFTPAESRVYGGQLYDLISKGDLKIKIFKHYPFTVDGVRQSQIDLTSGKTVGKLLIDVAE